ncbi:MAG TPA: MFS transporter [Gemmatimonadaceae bacterium]
MIGVPYGASYGIVTIALPFLLRREGLSVERIASLSAFVQAPAIWYFLWAPAVDFRLRRRTWVVVLSAATAVCSAAGVYFAGTGSVRLATASLVAACIVSQPISSALGGLVAETIPDPLRGRASGWSQAGMLGGGVAAGGSAVWLAGHASVGAAAAAAASLILLPSLVALTVPEPRAPRTQLVPHLRAMVRDVASMLRRREVVVALAFFLSPIGAGAAANLFPAVAAEYHASSSMIVWSAGLAALATPLGALLGGIICDRFNRWMVYPLSGVASALSSGAMAIAPMSPVTFLLGSAGYALTLGVCYAAFMALAFQLVGKATTASSTRFTLFMAAVNVPVVYVLKLDGRAYSRLGVRGMLLTDALSNLVFAGLLVLVLSALKLRRSSGDDRRIQAA